MPGISRHGVLLLSLLLVAVTVRLTAVAWWQSRVPDGVRFVFPDSESYWHLGLQIAQGKPYQYGSANARVFRAPGYPLLLAGVLLVTGEPANVTWVRTLSALLGTLTVGVVYWLTRLLFDRSTGLLAAAITAVYPGAIAMSILVLSEALFCPLMVLQLCLWVRAWRAEGKWTSLCWAALAGVAAGAATLVRPSWLLFTPLAVLVVCACYRPRGRQALLSAAMLVALILTMIPWWVRNYAVVGRFVPTTLQVGASLYDGLNPRATGASDMWWTVRDVPPLNVTGEYSRDRQLRDQAIRWAQQHPGKSLQLAGVKFLRLWNVWPNEASLAAWPVRLAVLAAYVPVMSLAACGAWLFIRRGWPYAVCLLPAVYFTALHVVFVSSIRYRQPAMLTLIVLAAGAAVALCQVVVARRRGQANKPQVAAPGGR
jgi:4-amino-4-deoxy-L-arabinose transferase-like glycosyltransferase